MKKILLGAIAAFATMSVGQAYAQEKLTVWWVKGFYKAEDDALFEAIKKFEDKSGVKVDLSQYAIQDMIPKTVFGDRRRQPFPTSHTQTSMISRSAARWAFEGRLEDISDIIDPMKDRSPPTRWRRRSSERQGEEEGLLRLPDEAADHAHRILADMLQQAGFKESDIPKDWKGYWSFWCDKVQPAYRSASGTRNFGIGQPMGVDSTDSFYSFLTFVDAYNVKLVDDDGKLLVDDPKVKAGPDRRADRLHRALSEGLRAAVRHKLEGSRQQRRLP